jgi:hypothetical protein
MRFLTSVKQGQSVAVNTGLTTLGEVLGDDRAYNASHFLFLPMDEVWQLKTRCAVLAESGADELPNVAQQNGLAYALGIAAVHDVVANAREQFASASLSQLLQAFLFWYDHDAFVVFDE